MRHQSLLRTLVSVVLIGFACFQALGFVGLVAGGGGVYALLAYGLLALLAAAAAVGLWIGRRWAPIVILVLGAVFAATRLYEGFVLGVRPWLPAVFLAVLAVVAALAVAALARENPRELR
jgi:hypothetical protein